jgi:hypothetical protein
MPSGRRLDGSAGSGHVGLVTALITGLQRILTDPRIQIQRCYQSCNRDTARTTVTGSGSPDTPVVDRPDKPSCCLTTSHAGPIQ